MSSPIPTEIRLRAISRLLAVTFDDGARFELPFEYLRVHSPSAEVKGHGPGQEVLVLGKQNVAIRAIEPVGQYAVKLVFDDGHDTGLFTWQYLYELGSKHAVNWARYQERVHEAGSVAPSTAVPGGSRGAGPGGACGGAGPHGSRGGAGAGGACGDKESRPPKEKGAER